MRLVNASFEEERTDVSAAQTWEIDETNVSDFHRIESGARSQGIKYWEKS
jgi:hypothetical protein